MKDELFQQHIQRIRSAALQGFSLKQIPGWIEKNTTLRGAPFSFLDHEFQLQILNDPSPRKNIRKCSQIGMSEMTVRAALAMVNIMDGFTAMYTLPTATFARTFSQTRFNPVIQSSPEVKYKLNADMDNAEVKQFGMSFLYIKGTRGQAAAISVPADALFHDELDFSDLEVVGSYQSRLTHSPYQLTWKFSTPTVEGLGISAEFETSRRFYNMCKCCHCNEWFLPDYFKHVRIPHYTGALNEISKSLLHRTHYQEAYLECPKCGEVPDLMPEHRQWVCENPNDNFIASGYQIQPFDAPRVITLPRLIETSLEYPRYVDFINFGLGKTAEDKDSSLTREDIDAMYVPGVRGGFYTHVMGIDMGLICHIVVAGVDPYGKMLVVHTEQVPLGRFEERYDALRAQYRVGMIVQDTVPYVETVMRLQKRNPNLWGALYVDMKDLTPFEVKVREEEPKAGKLDIRQVNINRNKALDMLMNEIREGEILMVEDANRDIFTHHLMDMKRIREVSQHKELGFIWQKTKGDDHFHHTLLYARVAVKMREMFTGGHHSLPMLHKIKVKEGVA